MTASRFSEEPIMQLLHRAEHSEPSISTLGREDRMTETTFDRWRQPCGGITISETQRLRELENENARLKRLLAERDLEGEALKVLLAQQS
jgi:putative transposase